MSWAQLGVWGRAPGGEGGDRGCWAVPGWACLGVPQEAPRSYHLCRQVAAQYELVHQAMIQPPVCNYVPFPWTTLVHVKAKHFHSLAHYHAAVALCDSPRECPAPRACVPAETLV